VKCENLRAAGSVAEQLTLDVVPDDIVDSARERAKSVPRGAGGLDAIVDAARERFGPAAVRPGSLLKYPQP
jgi:hypothetical protein